MTALQVLSCLCSVHFFVISMVARYSIFKRLSSDGNTVLAFGHFPELAVESFDCEHMHSQSAFLILQFTSNISKIILPSILKMVKNQFAL